MNGVMLKAQNTEITSKSEQSKNVGRLVCVGTGMHLAGQISTLSKSYIENSRCGFFVGNRWLCRAVARCFKR